MKTPAILIFFNTEILKKQYQELFPYKELRQKFRVQNLTNSLTETEDLKIQLNRFTKVIHALTHNCELSYRRHSSIAYMNRSRYYQVTKIYEKQLLFVTFKKPIFLYRLIIMLFSNTMGRRVLKYALHTLFHYEGFKLKHLLSQFDVFFLPYTGGISPEFDFLVWFAQRNRKTSIAIQENWDNLSSKQFLIHFPEIFLVWSNQSASHLRTIHYFDGIIVNVGSLRLNEIYKSRKSLKSHTATKRLTQNKKYSEILFVDSGSHVSDFLILKELSKFFTEKNLNKKSRIIYRSHPNNFSSKQKLSELDQIKKLPNIDVYFIDPNETNSFRIQQLKESKFIISIFSTYVLEAALLNMPIIIPTFSFDFVRKDEKSILDDLPHFNGFSMLNNVFLTPNLVDFKEKIQFLLKNRRTTENNDRLLDWYCTNVDSKSRVIDTLTNVISQK